MRALRAIAAALLACSGLAFAATPALATFHEMSIREIYAGSAEHPSAQYVELQMWRSGQNFVGGHDLLTYGPTGPPTENFLASDVPGDANQSTILIATQEAAEQFGITPDETLGPGNELKAAGGAVCWQDLDCASWGSFSGSLPSPAGAPAVAIPDGMALRRTIAPGCATLLEPTDDRDNSAADFSLVSPGPRPNSVAPSERACGAAGGQTEGGPNGSGGRGGHGAPQTTLKRKPPHMTTDRTPTFRFAADEAGSTFQCKLDGRPFKPCRSPFTPPKLTLGAHTFKVRARDESGQIDPTPAAYRFRIVRRG